MQPRHTIPEAGTGGDAKKIVKEQISYLPEYREIAAAYDDVTEFVIDPKGYFLIRTNEKKEIEVAFCTQLNKIAVKITGKTPIEIYQTIIKHNIIDRLDHAAYLGRELQKAYDALQAGIRYVQDSNLIFHKDK